MKNLLIACLCGALALSSLSSCKKKTKDEPIPTPNPTPGSNNVNLISRNWKMTYSSVPAPGIPNLPDSLPAFITDLYGRSQSCSQDDLLRFTTVASYSISEGETRCRPSDGSTIENGTWSFINNEAGISQKRFVPITLPDGTKSSRQIEVLSTLDSLTTTRMRLTYPQTVNGVTYSVSSGFVGK